MPIFREKTVYQITERHIRDGHRVDTHFCKNFTCKSNICICI